MNLNIVVYPDPILRKVSLHVEEFDEKLHKLLDAMYSKMMESNGIGLAAIQVAQPIRVLLINIPDENDVQSKETNLEIINPVVKQSSGVTTYQEGCLSVPGFYEDIQRDETISIEYQDRFGEKKLLKSDGLLSIAIQHEIDHLNGKVFVDRLSILRRKKFEKEYKKYLKGKKKN